MWLVIFLLDRCSFFYARLEIVRFPYFSLKLIYIRLGTLCYCYVILEYVWFGLCLVGLMTFVTPSFHLASNKVGVDVLEPDGLCRLRDVAGLSSMCYDGVGWEWYVVWVTGWNGMSFGLQVVGNGFDGVGLISVLVGSKWDGSFPFWLKVNIFW